ncbi:MAG: S53 family peptidase [Gammaproteobacteria bacterium]
MFSKNNLVSFMGGVLVVLAAVGIPLSVTAASAPRVGSVEAGPAVVQAASPSDIVKFTVYLPLRHQQELDNLLAQLHDPKSSHYQQWLQPSDFLQRFGPRLSDLAAVRAALIARGFTIIQSNAHGMRVQGPVSAVSSTFSVAINSRTHHGRRRFVARGALQLPDVLTALNARVMGLDAIPERQAHVYASGPAPASDIVDNRYTATGSYWFDDLKQAYDYPAYSKKTDGKGINVAVLMSDLIFPGDVDAVFNHENFTAITGLPVPSVTTVTVDGGGVYNGNGSLEASLDVQQVLGGAPGANVTLVSIPDLSDQSIIDGYTYIVDSNQFDIVNSSFGGCELEYTRAYNGGVDYTYILQQYHEIFEQGNAQGITFVASSGDQGGLLCPSADYGNPGASPVFVPGVSTPSDDPNVTSVGGGNLITANDGTLNSAYVRESAFADPELPYDIYGIGQNVSGGVWGAGGGISSVFRKPLYQWLANTGSIFWRTQPDVGMQVGGLGYSQLNGSAPGFCDSSAYSCSPDDSSVLTAYGVNYGGGFYFTIGTSVASPEFVGALALFEQQFGKHHRQGNVNYFLYARGALQSLAGGVHAPAAFQFYHRNIPGFDGAWNGGYPSYNYDYIYGNGSPDVRKLFGLKGPAAGVPQTPSNP